MSLKGQVALVVGGASGIGLATAKSLLSEGANVVICDISGNGEVIVQELESEFGAQRSLFVHGDVRDDDQLEAAFTITKSKYKGLDIVVQSAGILNDADWNLSVDVNLKGVIRGTLLAWKYMGKHEGGKGGVVVNIASIAALISFHICPIYSATKHGVMGFSRSCGEPYHLNRTGVRIITMCPGNTETELLGKAKLMTSELHEEIEKQQSIFPSQSADNVAKGVLHVIQNGASGSVWVSECKQPAYQVNFPMYPEMRAKE